MHICSLMSCKCYTEGKKMLPLKIYIPDNGILLRSNFGLALLAMMLGLKDRYNQIQQFLNYIQISLFTPPGSIQSGLTTDWKQKVGCFPSERYLELIPVNQKNSCTLPFLRPKQPLRLKH